MRNLPDEDLFRELKGRLQVYEEQPDDQRWDRISGSIPHDIPTWIRWSDGTALTCTILMLLSMLYFPNPKYPSRVNDSKGLFDSTRLALEPESVGAVQSKKHHTQRDLNALFNDYRPIDDPMTMFASPMYPGGGEEGGNVGQRLPTFPLSCRRSTERSRLMNAPE